VTYRSSSEKRVEKFLVNFFGFIMLLVLNFLHAWLVMLGLDAANDHWPQVPALGYWATFVILLGLSSIAGSIHGGMRVKLKDD
jgi:hypothetical protein